MEFKDAVDALGAGRPDKRFPILARCCFARIARRDGSSASSVGASAPGERLCGSATKAAVSCYVYVSLLSQ